MRSLAIPLSQKIVCVGLNHREHASEGAAEIPERPLLFAKWPNILIGHEEAIVVPAALTAEIDYEGELGVGVGRQARHVSGQDALDVIGGYVCANEPGDLVLTGTPAGSRRAPGRRRC